MQDTQIKKTVASTQTDNLYNEDNLFTGSTSVTNEVKQEFEDWFKVKIQGVVKSYKIHANGSLQIKFQEITEKTVDGVTFNSYEDKSIRITQPKPFTEKSAKDFIGKSVEIINVKETAQYKKIAEGQYDFNRIERYVYSADNIKIIEKSVENDYQLFKIFDLKVKDVIPSLKYDARKRKQVIDKDKSVLLYETENGTLSTLHKITVVDLPYSQAQELKGKDIVVLDLKQIGKNYFCSKIKLKS